MGVGEGDDRDGREKDGKRDRSRRKKRDRDGREKDRETGAGEREIGRETGVGEREGRKRKNYKHKQIHGTLSCRNTIQKCIMYTICNNL